MVSTAFALQKLLYIKRDADFMFASGTQLIFFQARFARFAYMTYTWSNSSNSDISAVDYHIQLINLLEYTNLIS